MLGRILRVLIGFIMACLAAGFTKVFFAYTPAELSSLPPDVASDRMSKVLDLGLYAAAQSGIFSAPFALVTAAIGEWRRVTNWIYYAIVGIAISMVGFMAQYSGETAGGPTIANNYAFTAFLTAGFLAGFTYWLFAGRFAGGSAGPAPTPAPTSKPLTTDAKAAPAKPTSVPAAGTTKPSGSTPGSTSTSASKPAGSGGTASSRNGGNGGKH